MTQRSRFSIMGGTRALTMLPTTALPAHINGGTVSNRAVGRLRRWVMY